MKKYGMTDLGEINYCLGIRFQRDKETKEIRLDQERYLHEVLEKFGMTDCKGVCTPLEMKVEDNRERVEGENQLKVMHNIPYQQAIGSLMYLSVSTRPDITYAVSYLSQFNREPTEFDWKNVKRVFRYLKQTPHKALIFSKQGNFRVTGYADADWAGDRRDRKSYTGYVFKIGSGVISWESRKQGSVALSTTEAEYMAVSEASTEAVFLRNLCKEVLALSPEITILYSENQGAIKLAHNPVFHKRSKHIDIRYHCIRSWISENKFVLKYISTEKMIADMLTKSLGQNKHKFCIDNIFRN